MAANYEPLIDGIARLLGVTGRDSEDGIRGAHSSSDVERWLGQSLSAPDRQVPIIHDYLRGADALNEAAQTGATHVREIDVPTWQFHQNELQGSIDGDPEMQQAIKDLYVNSRTPADPDVTTQVVKPRATRTVGSAPGNSPIASPEGPVSPTGGDVSVEGAPDTQMAPQAEPAVKPTAAEAKMQADRSRAWHDFGNNSVAGNAVGIEDALDRIKALHAPDDAALPPGQTADWRKAINYMQGLEDKVAEMKQLQIPNDQWSRELVNFKEHSAIDALDLPKYVHDTIDHYNAWADSQKPPTLTDRFTQALGVPRAIQTSIDLSAPGRQGILMMSRPEYWQHMGTMVGALDENKYLASQNYMRDHPDWQTSQDAGLAITDLHSKLAPKEEAFRSQMAENIPIVGPAIKASEQAYTTFLNRLRFDTFSNLLKEAQAAGIDSKDTKFLKDLAEWVNTATGRGGGKGFNPGPLADIMFSPRLAWARFQTLNPFYYAQMHPFVRAQAIKTQLASAGMIYGLISIAAMGGAKVVWDFRNPDAGKVRVGNTRLDLGGGMFQWLRLFTQLATNQKVNSETGVASTLGQKAFSASRLDVMTQFLISKEAPVASFVTDWMRGKDMQGKKFNLTDAAISRLVPLGMQDMYDALKGQGVQGLLLAAPAATFGVGVQTYAPSMHPETVPFIGVKGQIPDAMAKDYAQAIQDADTRAATMAAVRSKNLGPVAAKAILRAYVKAERLKARAAWIRANAQAFRQAKLAGQATVPLVAPEGSQ